MQHVVRRESPREWSGVGCKYPYSLLEEISEPAVYPVGMT